MAHDDVVAISDRATDALNVVFNTEVGREWLVRERGVDAPLVEALAHLGLSSLCNVLACIELAKRDDLGPDDALVFKKGRVLTSEDVAALRRQGFETVMACKLGAGDVAEDQAATRIAAVAGGEHVETELPFTGRVNLRAGADGVVMLDPARIDRLNRVDEAITIATLPNMAAVRAGQMIATVKIIPFAVAAGPRDAAIALADAAKPVVRVAPYHIRKLGIVSTILPGLSPKVVDKTLRVTADRIAPRVVSRWTLRFVTIPATASRR
jgi:hypothetical protein